MNEEKTKHFPSSQDSPQFAEGKNVERGEGGRGNGSFPVPESSDHALRGSVENGRVLKVKLATPKGGASLIDGPLLFLIVAIIIIVFAALIAVSYKGGAPGAGSTPPALVPSQNAQQPLSVDEKVKILNSMKTSSDDAKGLSVEEKRAILNGLRTQPAAGNKELSVEEKMKILNSLK